MPDYRFISLDYEASIPRGLTNTFVVRGDNWNDFTNHVRFDLIYFDGGGERTKIGKLKALHRMPYGAGNIVESKTELPDSFFELEEGYISLGQSEDYYVALGTLFGTLEAVEILRALRDIAELPGIVADFETSAPFRNGMMRDNAAKRARRFGRAWVRGDPVSIEPAFTYACRLGDSPLPITARFDFAPKAKLPSRIVAIIGRNAVGKTAFLSKLAADLAQFERLSEERLSDKLDRFPDDSPLFSRVIAISYSAFDRFSRPEVTPYSSYIYCGIRDERGNMSQRALNGSYNRNRRRIKEHGREKDWIRHILEILGDAEGLTRDRLYEEMHSEDGTQLLAELSSG